MPRIEDTGDICLRKPRPTQGCRDAAAADDDKDISPLKVFNLMSAVALH
jgi:hypothetical protein